MALALLQCKHTTINPPLYRIEWWNAAEIIVSSCFNFRLCLLTVGICVSEFTEVECQQNYFASITQIVVISFMN